MALLDFSRASGRSVTSADRFNRLIASTIGALASWNDARNTRNALAKLSDHELDDLGISRGDIDRITGKSFY
ncbi:MAG: DUF1127 domain-containing protein [Boseongicola sp.]|nr:DUF1127 domain-containing protein [Boseongicola sp.]MDD9977390.1 DUF1127 domain-containing protein [Boseongicola sp.]